MMLIDEAVSYRVYFVAIGTVCGSYIPQGDPVSNANRP